MLFVCLLERACCGEVLGVVFTNAEAPELACLRAIAAAERAGVVEREHDDHVLSIKAKQVGASSWPIPVMDRLIPPAEARQFIEAERVGATVH